MSSITNELKKHILATLAYYDAMDYPMTAFEVWKYLTRISEEGPKEGDSYSLYEVMAGLEADNIRKFIDENRGFYFLKGRGNLVGQRLEKNKIANKKYRIIRKYVKILRFVPFVRMLAVTGSMGMKNADAGSDLDLLVVLKHGRIFTGRLLVSGALFIFGKKRHGEKIKDRFCLNYFITEKSLGINLKDLFSASEYSFVLPIFGFETFEKFGKENFWIKGYKPNRGDFEICNLKLQKDSFFSRAIREAGEKILDFDLLEKNLKRWQIERINKNPKTRQEGSMVVANDEMMIFLPEPQGPKIFEKFKTCLSSLERQ